MSTWECQKCGVATFASRNKLFAHLKACLVDHNPTQRVFPSDEEFCKGKDVYIYVTGGRIRGKTLGNVERFNVATKTWETMPRLQENRGSHGSAAVDAYLYIIGGGGFRSNLSSIERLDCRTGEYHNLAVTPTTRHALYCLAVDRSIYAVGGWINGSVGATQLERYDIDSDAWTVLAPMPTGRRLLGAAELGNRIYTFGGNLGDGEWNSNATEIYDIATDSWAKGPDLPVAGQASAAAVGDFVFVVMHGHYVLRLCPRTLTFTRCADTLPLPRWFCFDLTVVNASLYLAGGNVEGVWSSVLWRYDVLTGRWEELPSMDRERRRCSAALVVLPKSEATASPVEQTDA